MDHIADFVRISKLETQFYSDPEYTQHVKYVSRSSTRQRSVRKEENWKRERGLGQGGSGIVWLERCIQGDSKGEVRAVKKVPKLEASDYYRELEAIALFSNTKYEHCFVKSSGWYDDDDSIYITMEYLPNGDLHRYLSSPLSEKEGQQIVFQILEGLQFMHEIGFAHRDLKPANILIVSKGPDWWVKIADFGISKRATKGLTVLRTQTGTPAFAAPEVLGYFRLDDTSDDSYTNAVDIWSLGVITFFILTGEILFKNQRRLGQYVAGSFTLPLDVLVANKVSAQGCDFVRSLLASKSEDRPTVKECLNSPWSHYLAGALETQREINISNSSPTLSNPEPSASWSTQDQISAHEMHRSVDVRFERAKSTSNKTIAQSISEPAIQADWKLLRKFEGHSGEVLAIAFSPDGKQIASASRDGTVRLWDSATGTARGTLKGHSRCVSAIAFSPDGKKIVSASFDKTIRFWDSVSGAARVMHEGSFDHILTIAFSPNGKQVVFGSDIGTITIWDSAVGVLPNRLKARSRLVSAIALSSNRRQTASTSRDATVRRWDLVSRAARGTLEGHLGRVTAIAFSPDGKQIASGSRGGTVRLWDSVSGAACGTLEGHLGRVTAISFSPDGKQITSASYDGTVRLWDSITKTTLDTFKGHSDLVVAIAFSPNGKQIASASDDTKIKIWNLITKTHDTLEGHLGRVTAIAFSPDGKRIASASHNGTIRLWIWDSAMRLAVPVNEDTVSKSSTKLVI